MCAWNVTRTRGLNVKCGARCGLATAALSSALRVGVWTALYGKGVRLLGCRFFCKPFPEAYERWVVSTVVRPDKVIRVLGGGRFFKQGQEFASTDLILE